VRPGGTFATSSPGVPRPRVLHLIKGLGLGGAEHLLVDVVATADRERFDYEVAYVLATQDTLAPALEAAGVPVHRLGATGNADLRWTAALRRLLAAGRYDVVHSHLPYSAALGRLVTMTLPRRRRPVLVYTEHSLWDRTALITRVLNRATIGLDRALFVVSDAARDALPRSLRPRARVVVHGVERAVFGGLLDHRDEVRRAVRAELGVPDGDVIALTVANLRSEKGYDVLLEAARLAVAAGAPVRFVSVGHGPLQTALATAAQAMELGGRFRFLGTRTDTARLMVGADIFVLPSHHEGMPVALMEAMSAGLPIVATAVGGVPDVVTDGVEGLLVAPGRADLLAEAVTSLARQPDLRDRLARASLARSAPFDITRATAAIESVYDELLEKRRR